MKFTKMSLVAALLVGTSAFAVENIKVSGDAKVFYDTSDEERLVNGNDDAELFNMADSAAQAAISLSVGADLVDGISAGAKMTALSTLGLEGQLVGNVWEATNGVTDSFITNELWIAGTTGNTTGKIGRMELDTPLVFSEQWSIVANTFEAAVVINQDIPDTTVVAAYVGGSNGSLNGGNGGNGGGGGVGGVIDAPAAGSTFSQFWNGAYAIGVVNNSFEPLTVQAWYYDATNIIRAYWLQADLSMEGIMLGAQYSGNDITGVDDDGSVYAVMAGYEMKDTFTAKVSYSGTDENVGAGFNLSGTGQSKLYTEAWWQYTFITQADTQSYNVTVEAPVADIVDLGLYYTSVDQSTDAGDNDTDDLTLTASKSFGPLDSSLVYSNIKVQDNDAYNQIQVYLTLNF